MKLRISSLNHTWIFDLDGTILKHNGYLIDGHDTILPGVKKIINAIDKNDVIILLTSRKLTYKNKTINFLKKNKIRYNAIIFNIPYGERILVNDCKPSGLKTAIAINKKRDNNLDISLIIDKKL